MAKSPPIAIIGVSSQFAGSSDVLEFWRDIISATDRITEVPPSHWLVDDYYDADPTVPDMTYAKRGGFLKPISFDPMEFGIPPKAIPATDTAQLVALMAAKRILKDAWRFREGEVDRSRVSVILGVASATELVVQMGSRLQHPIWRKALRDGGLPESKVIEIVKRIGDHYQPWQESSFPGLLGNVVAGRIANRLDLGGSNFVTDAACASSLSALQAGLAELYLGDSDMVVAGGVDALNDILMYMCFSKTPAFSPTGDCRPFSEDADGTLIGEGVGMVALRRLEDAERDGDPIYAVIKGLGASSDGQASSVYAPRPEGQANALMRAYGKAGYGPETVELVEGHGTATKAGDVAEVAGLMSVFAPSNPEGKAWCALGSVKSQIGHTKAAAGAAGLIKVALGLHHKILPPTLKVSRPNPKLGIEGGPLYINTQARPWIRGSDHPRRGSVSSFGFGGSNFHVAVEEYTGPGRRAERLRAWPDELVLLSAPTRDALGDDLLQVGTSIEAGRPLGLIAHESLSAFESGAEARVAIVASSLEELAAKIEGAAQTLKAGSGAVQRDPDVIFGFGKVDKGRLAFLFPGQGSQYVGMGGAAAMTFESARAVWDGAADLELFADNPLHRAVFPPPAFSDEERAAQLRTLTEMAMAQPAIAAVSLGYMSLLEKLGVTPDVVAGHSFGEVTALAAAGRLDPLHLLSIARRRGELMAEAAANEAGAMLAASASAEAVAALIAEDTGVVVANDNSPTEVVLAGSEKAIEDFRQLLKGEGITSVRLPVASAFHSSIVAGSCEPFHDFLASVEWSDEGVEVYANTTAGTYPKKADEARRLLADQLASRVRFREMIQGMHAAGVTHFVEVGPGGVLTKLVGRCLDKGTHVAVSLDDKRAPGLRGLWRGLGKLAAAGVEMSLADLADGYRLPEAPPEKKAHQIMISGSNHEKPYPPENGNAGLPAPNPEVVERPVQAPPVAAALGAPVTAQVPAVAAPSPAPMALPAAASPAVFSSDLAQLQLRTIEAHQHFQTLMADSHQRFLDMAASAIAGLPHSPGLPAAAQVQVAYPNVPTPAVFTQPIVVPAVPAVAPVQLRAAEAVAPPAVVVAPPPAPAEPAAAAQPVDTTALALAVVAEKTGYPVDMLDLDMEMEAGLGIDSIKQVEILSELQSRMPGMPEIAPSELATLRTLRDVANKLAAAPVMQAAAAPPEIAVAAADVAAAPTPAAATPAPIDTTALALAVVAEKTGYPVEMLDLDMEMEAGLGIDSIKQVEILSELQSRMPGMPEILPSDLASMRTLRDVANKLAAVPVAPATLAVSHAAAPVAPIDTTALALAVVAEKTGYPVEMLDLDMEMEAGLGIDSIKQVEILSELQSRMPGMPEIAPSELAGLRTLRDVANKLSAAPSATASVSSTVVASPPPSDVAAPPAADEPIDTTALALAVVAEKTGYPIEMLDLDMEMEAGLGIDSIKQVEILSELQSRMPGMPEISPSDLSSLRTLRDVANKLRGPVEAELIVLVQADNPAPKSDVPAHPVPSVALASTPADVDVSAYAPRIVPEPRPDFRLGALTRGVRVKVTNEHPKLAAAIAKGLRARGVTAKVGKVNASDSAVISLAALTATQPGPDTSIDFHCGVVEVARVVAQHPDPTERLFVTIQSTGGDFGLSSDPGAHAWTSGVAGIVKTAAREWPGASLKAIDVANPETAAEEIVNELFLGGPAIEVGIAADGMRNVLRLEALVGDATVGPALGRGSVVVVSGGARGVTATCAAKLAEEWGVRLALLGRSTLGEWPAGVPLTSDPVQLTGALAAAARERGEAVELATIQKEAHTLAASAAVRFSLAELDARGIEALYISADVGDAGQVSAALDDVREKWGPIAGIVHGAGVLRDKAIAELTSDRVADVFGPKVLGLSALLEATKDDPIRLIALFSSIAARTGNAGQAAYAAANEVLNKVAAAEAYRRGDSCKVRSYNWGPWAGGMVDAGLAAHFAKQGVALLGLEAGAQFFVDELERDGEGVERVVLASPSFPSTTHRLTFTTKAGAYGSDAPGGRSGVAPAIVADLALRIGHALKPVRSMRTYLENLVVSKFRGLVGEGAQDDSDQNHFVDVIPVGLDTPGYQLVFRDADGNIHHETQIRYSMIGAAPPPSVPSGGLEPWAFDVRSVYETVLSRVSDFQSILHLEGVSEDGGMALLRNAARLGWPSRGSVFGFDPAALDGLLQLGALWTHQKVGAVQKVVGVGSMVIHNLETLPERLRSAFRATRTTTGTLFDFVLATEEGDLVAELREVAFDIQGA
ncbi:MAG: SDR family NAD(P)-dependent oxidoreductase [Gemmatimonadetes bacterium]|nr:SDR family NAD(P)-dependent oxidoreductase [Gemmatimonadota bacterium]